MKKNTKKLFEVILFKSRYIILLAVIGLIISAVFIFGWTFINFTEFSFFEVHNTKEVIIKLITAIDLYLLGIVTLIVSYTLYEIYLKSNNAKIRIPRAFVVNSLNDLKDKLTSVILILLIITYFQQSIGLKYKNSYELLAFAVGILAISLAIYLSKKKYIKTADLIRQIHKDIEDNKK